jgi:hypothetical protein
VGGAVGMTSLAGLVGPGTTAPCGDPGVDADEPATPSPRAKQPSTATTTVMVLARDFFEVHAERSDVRALCPPALTWPSGPE